MLQRELVNFGLPGTSPVAHCRGEAWPWKPWIFLSMWRDKIGPYVSWGFNRIGVVELLNPHRIKVQPQKKKSFGRT